MRSCVLAVAVAVQVLPATILAATWTVKPDGTGDFPTIQAAVTGSVNNDTILLTDGTFSGAGNRNVSYAGKAITIQSVNGPGAVTIDCGGQPGFQFVTLETAASVLRGVTIINTPLALNCHPGSPLIESCIINGNGTTTGIEAGVYLNESPKPANPQMESCTLNFCGTATQTLEYASIAFRNGSVTGCNRAYVGLLGGYFNATNSQFTSNGAGASLNGIGFSAGGSFSGCSFVGNAASAIAMSGNMYVSITDCYFEGNHQAVAASSNPAVDIVGCIFVNNSAVNGGQYSNGGAVWADSGPPLTLTNNVFCGNSALGSGGAVYVLNTTLAITGNTFVRNSSAAGGGAIHLFGVYTIGNIKNNIIAFSTQGPGVMCASGANPTLSCNDVYGNAGGDGICGTNSDNNISLDPLLCSDDCTDLGIAADSPCTAANSPCGTQIGAVGVTCGPVPVLFQTVTARALDDGVQITWSIAADEAIESFAVLRDSRVIGADLAASDRIFVDTGVKPGVSYRYTVMATTSDGGVFQSQAIPVRMPAVQLELTQNEPNPFNPTTRIAFTLPEAAIVDVSVFDVGGKYVATLVSGPHPAGDNSATWNGNDGRGNSVGSGVYFCRLTAGGVTRTIKMVLMK